MIFIYITGDAPNANELKLWGCKALAIAHAQGATAKGVEGEWEVSEQPVGHAPNLDDTVVMCMLDSSS